MSPDILIPAYCPSLPPSTKIINSVTLHSTFFSTPPPPGHITAGLTIVLHTYFNLVLKMPFYHKSLLSPTSTHSTLFALFFPSPLWTVDHKYLNSSFCTASTPCSCTIPSLLSLVHAPFSLLLLTFILLLSNEYLNLSRIALTCSLISLQITLSSADIIVHVEFCLEDLWSSSR